MIASPFWKFSVGSFGTAIPVIEQNYCMLWIYNLWARSPYFMQKVDVTNISFTINQLLKQIENGEEIVIISHGKPIARLSSISHSPQPLTSRHKLRTTQPQTLISNQEIIQSLRQEARY